MSGELSTVIGVVVGAILGGGAQSLNAWFQDSRSRKAQLRAERRDLYVEVLAVHYSHIDARARARADNWDKLEWFEHFRKTMNDVARVRATLKIQAPADTASAGSKLLEKIAERPVDAEPEDFTAEFDAFRKFAQRDLGIKN